MVLFASHRALLKGWGERATNEVQQKVNFKAIQNARDHLQFVFILREKKEITRQCNTLIEKVTGRPQRVIPCAG